MATAAGAHGCTDGWTHHDLHSMDGMDERIGTDKSWPGKNGVVYFWVSANRRRMRCSPSARPTAYIVMAYVVMAYIFMACTAMVYIVVAYIVMAFIVMAYTVMAYIVMAYIAMAYVGMAYIVMACIAMAYIVT